MYPLGEEDAPYPGKVEDVFNQSPNKEDAAKGAELPTEGLYKRTIGAEKGIGQLGTVVKEHSE